MLIKFEVKIELPIIRLGSLFERLEQVLDAVRGERRLTIRVVNKAPLEFRGIVDNPSDDSGILLLILLLGKPIEHWYLSNDVNLSMDSDDRLGASELSPSEYGHAQVNGRGVNSIESAMQFKLLRDTSGLGNSHHIESELLKDAMFSESVGLRQHLSVDRLVAKSKVLRANGSNETSTNLWSCRCTWRVYA